MPQRKPQRNISWPTYTPRNDFHNDADFLDNGNGANAGRCIYWKGLDRIFLKRPCPFRVPPWFGKEKLYHGYDTSIQVPGGGVLSYRLHVIPLRCCTVYDINRNKKRRRREKKHTDSNNSKRNVTAVFTLKRNVFVSPLLRLLQIRQL